MLEKLKDLIAEQLDVDKEKITEESNFNEDLGVDSLELFELVMSLEDTFGVEIPSEDLEKIATVGDVVEYLKSKGVE
ncbi:MAG: acyl carrier protein [Roseburia sp.]